MQEPQETQVQSLDQEDPLEKEMVNLSKPCLENSKDSSGSGGLQTIGSQRVSRNWARAHT